MQIDFKNLILLKLKTLKTQAFTSPCDCLLIAKGARCFISIPCQLVHALLSPETLLKSATECIVYSTNDSAPEFKKNLPPFFANYRFVITT